jgi:hypothetical protein
LFSLFCPGDLFLISSVTGVYKYEDHPKLVARQMALRSSRFAAQPPGHHSILR